MPLPGRGPTPEINDFADLQPAAMPGSTYVRPQQYDPAGNDLLRLSQGLGDLNPSLQRFGVALQQRQDQDALRQVQAQEPLKSDKEAEADFIKSGTPSDFDPAGIAQSKLYGMRRAQQLIQDATTDLGTRDVDWRTFDASGYLAQRKKDYSDIFGGNEFASIGFNDALQGFDGKLMTMRTQGAVKQIKTIGEDNTFQAIRFAGEQAADEDGATPASVAQAVRKAIHAVSGPNGSQGTSFADADKNTIQLAANWVSQGKRLDAAIGLLTTPREDEKGNPLPPLINTASNQQQVQSIIKTATAAKEKEAKQAALQGITDADTTMLSSGAGRLATVGDITYRGDDEDGTPKTITATQRQTAATRQYITKLSPQLAAANRETPAQTFDRELAAVSNGGVNHPVWKSTLEAAPQAASAADMSDLTKRDRLLQAANLYDQLREKNPLYLQQLVDKKTQDFFDLYRTAKGLPSPSGNGQVTMEEAANMASQATAAGKDADDTLKGHFKQIEQKVSAVDPRSFWATYAPNWAGGESAPVNTGYIQQQVTEKAKLFARLGLAPDEAISQASQAVKDSSTIVNGWVVPNLGTQVPGGFPKAVANYMQTFSDQYGSLNNGISKNQIGVATNGAGVFTLTGPNGVALRTPSGIARFTLKDLTDLGQNQDAQTRARLLQDAATKRQAIDTSGVKDPQTRSLLDAYNGATSMSGSNAIAFPDMGETLPPKPQASAGSSLVGRLASGAGELLGALNPMGSAKANTNASAPLNTSRTIDVGPDNQGVPGNPIKGTSNHMKGQYGAPGYNLTDIVTSSGRKLTVHSEAAPAFNGFLNELEGMGYKLGPGTYGYSNREQANGSGRISQHAYGNAIDINPGKNPFRTNETDLPRNVSQIAEKWGLTWGGDWSGHSRDPMHFEWTGHRPWLRNTQTAKKD